MWGSERHGVLSVTQLSALLTLLAVATLGLAYAAPTAAVRTTYLAQAASSEQANTSANTECPKEDKTHLYFGKLNSGEDADLAARGITNLSDKLCTETNQHFTVYGTCDAPDKCHAHYCTNMAGKKVVCNAPYLSNMSGLAIPDQTVDQLMLNPTPLSEQQVTLQPLNANLNLPSQQYGILSGSPTTVGSDPVPEEFFANYANESDAEKSLDRDFNPATLGQMPTFVSSQSVTVDPLTGSEIMEPETEAVSSISSSPAEVSYPSYPNAEITISSVETGTGGEPSSPTVEPQPIVTLNNNPELYTESTFNTFTNSSAAPGSPNVEDRTEPQGMFQQFTHWVQTWW
jgi:hypothetical protein